jgi:hypothetical protein
VESLNLLENNNVLDMPEISRFFGIIIYMYSKDHLPPHFHAEYGDEEGMFSIETCNIIKGDLPRKQTRLVQAWAELHQEELMSNYLELQQEQATFFKIKPLE